MTITKTSKCGTLRVQKFTSGTMASFTVNFLTADGRWMTVGDAETARQATNLFKSFGGY
jgi:hypothetical protein